MIKCLRIIHFSVLDIPLTLTAILPSHSLEKLCVVPKLVANFPDNFYKSSFSPWQAGIKLLQLIALMKALTTLHYYVFKLFSLLLNELIAYCHDCFSSLYEHQRATASELLIQSNLCVNQLCVNRVLISCGIVVVLLISCCCSLTQSKRKKHFMWC